MVWLIVLTYVGGVVLVLAEFLVPGGVCGFVGALLVFTSAGLSCYHFPGLALFILLAQAIGIAAAFVAGIQLLPRTRLGRSLILVDSQQADEGWVAWESNEVLVGKTAEVATALRPAGTILIDGERIDAVSDGQFIEKGAQVKVMEVRGSRVVVERAQDAP
ncbi:MAG TPA: hypothetical protein ENN80_15815 [Candidatus Hydrogenedentes bacterium]|nr:hypothetical protein [Candidatus Hydrogenedentota bacterium]